MSSSDIENVLSSIRRLVTEDLRPRAPAPAPEQPEPIVGKLLLTPALRVVEPPSAPEPRPPIDDLLTLIGARVAPPAAGFEAETGDAFEAAAERVPPRPVVVFSQPAPSAEPEDEVQQWAGDEPDPEPEAAEETGMASVADEIADEDFAEATDPDADAVLPVVDLDEETLRDLIRDVLREELQGPMGERITRNIRKLVRAELARAVALRNVE